MQLPSSASFDIDHQLIAIAGFDANQNEQSLNQQAVNIIASGPSIAHLAFVELLDTATIFVNGSISLLAEHTFNNVVGWVISDARFISHQPEVFTKYYNGQPLYATLAVFEAIAASHPNIIREYSSSMRILYPVDRPWSVKANKLGFDILSFKQKLFNKKMPLSHFANDPNFVIDNEHKPVPIGVSLDVTQGFVEAGTVVYVAAQLAFSRNAGAIHLYGVDLINSNLPRFYENTENSAPSKLDKAVSERIVPSLNLLGRVYKQHGVPVINHSPVSQYLFDDLG
ncbi:hypothetical protein [Psychrobacter sp. M13]|uniref:hypothetical protein n=1 Tax=Psychrobacter sp. M13 TaxID=3067275 RepID=UPI00273C2FAC|nr:hypothetical protein [Psychrobacter sp. M13]WLP95684.1 hypothetical protein Q9G97_06190 [Psychrobacter sp. M13]